MSTHSCNSSCNSRRSRSSTESRISRYSDDELLEEIRCRGLQSTSKSRPNDKDRQSIGSQSRQVDEEHQSPCSRSPPPDIGCGGCCGGAGSSSRPTSSRKSPKYPISAQCSPVTQAHHMTPEYGRPAQRSPLPTSQETTPVETPVETPTFGPTPDVTPPDTPKMYVSLSSFVSKVVGLCV